MDFAKYPPGADYIEGSQWSLIYKLPNLSELEAIFPYFVLTAQPFELKTEIFLLLILTTTVGTENRASPKGATIAVTLVFVPALFLNKLYSNTRRVVLLRLGI